MIVDLPSSTYARAPARWRWEGDWRGVKFDASEDDVRRQIAAARRLAVEVMPGAQERAEVVRWVGD